YRKAVAISPEAVHYMNLGNALVSKGASEGDNEVIRKGIEALENALRIDPNFERAKKNLARARQLLSTP
ncbi:MAG: hypothetical protein HY721_17440, partial [Planctomycetes bacterium]|nr:hypothetical protein [Planctomycetota bacterium]